MLPPHTRARALAASPGRDVGVGVVVGARRTGQYKSVVDLVTTLVKQGGPRALFGGLGPSLAGVIPFAGVNFMTYDGLRWTYSKVTGESKVPKSVALFSGSIAGVTAATVAFPLEVVRRRMMMGAKFKGTADALLTISKTEGIGALFKGCTLNWVKMAPGTGLQLYVYEATKEACPFVPVVRTLEHIRPTRTRRPARAAAGARLLIDRKWSHCIR